MPNVNYTRIFKETTFNVRPGSPTFTDHEILSESLVIEHGYEYLRTTKDRRLITDKIKGPKRVTGSILLNFQFDRIGQIIKAALAKETVTQPDSVGDPTVYSHKFVHEDDPSVTLPTYGIDIGVEGVRERRVSGFAVNRLSLDWEGAGGVAVTAETLGADETHAALFTGSLTYSSVAWLTGADITSFQINAAEVTPERFSLTINNNYPGVHAFKKRTLPKIEFGQLEVTGEMSIRFDSNTHMADFIDETERDVYIKFQGAGIGASTRKYELEIDVNRILYDAGDAHLDQQSRVVQNLPFTALKPSTGDFFALILQNITSGAY